MMTRGDLIQSGLEIIRKSDKEDVDLISRVLNRCYYRIWEMAPWDAGKIQMSHTFTAAETDGRYLRSDLVGILAVVDESNDVRYHKTSEEKRYALDGKYHWYHPSCQVTPVDEVTKGIGVASGNTSISGSSYLSGNQSGEYVQFADQPGYYCFTSTTAFTPVYYGPTLVNKGCVVRPRSTKKLVIVDDTGELDATTVQVYGWIYPPPLYHDSQTSLLPHDRALQLMMWIDLIGPIEKRRNEAQDYRNELYGPDMMGGVLADMLTKTERTLGPVIPRDRRGDIVQFGRKR